MNIDILENPQRSQVGWLISTNQEFATIYRQAFQYVQEVVTDVFLGPKPLVILPATQPIGAPLHHDIYWVNLRRMNITKFMPPLLLVNDVFLKECLQSNLSEINNLTALLADFRNWHDEKGLEMVVFVAETASTQTERTEMPTEPTEPVATEPASEEPASETAQQVVGEAMEVTLPAVQGVVRATSVEEEEEDDG